MKKLKKLKKVVIMKLLRCNVWNVRYTPHCEAFDTDTKMCNIESKNCLCACAPYTHEEIVLHNKWVKLMESVERHSEQVAQRDKEEKKENEI